MKKIATALILSLAVLSTQAGCAATMAARQPGKISIDKVKPGVDREKVVSILGAPLNKKDMEDGKFSEIYKVKQGYSTTVKALRAVGHVTGDLLTLFLWEIAGIPIESIYDGDDLSIKILYGKEGNVIHVDVTRVEDDI